jgi:diguanylate cyclase (GGDEF)-like protein
MTILYILLFLYTFSTAIITNYLRFKCSDLLNKLILILSSLLLVELHSLLFDFTYTKWILLVFVGLSVFCFRTLGGIISACIAWFVLFIQTNENGLFLLVNYLFFAIGVSFITHYIRKMRVESEMRLTKLIENSKQLNVFREVSIAMQQTLHLQSLLKTILTSVTAGHGLGFNRAMILLIDEDGAKLKGIMGTGPMTVEEGYATWERITKNKYQLKDLLEIKETEKPTDSSLNQRVKKLEISLDEPHFLNKTLESRNPLHIKEFDDSDKTLLLFASQFKMDELAVIPLINQGIKVGVLIIDNPVNKRPITASDIDSVIPLANQAAIAIHYTRLFSEIEDMAHKDGLTGLLNQRAFQTLLETHFPKDSQDRLSLIILDIDSFKHFNDTNGHLLGNEVLIQLAKVVQHSIIDDQLAFRFGGEEFVILLPHTDIQMAGVIAEQIRKNVENTSFPCGEKQPKGRLTISLGVASSESLQTSSTHELVDLADKALYQAKESGKNKVAAYEGSIKVESS